MRYKKNKKRIDPRYFLHETADRDREILLEAVDPAIEELAKRLEVPLLRHGFTNQELVEFVYQIIEASPKTGQSGEVHVPSRPYRGPVPVGSGLPGKEKPGMTRKELEKRTRPWSNPAAGEPKAAFPPAYTSPTYEEDPEGLVGSPAGQAIEKLLVRREQKENNTRMKVELRNARRAFLMHVGSPRSRRVGRGTGRIQQAAHRQAQTLGALPEPENISPWASE